MLEMCSDVQEGSKWQLQDTRFLVRQGVTLGACTVSSAPTTKQFSSKQCWCGRGTSGIVRPHQLPNLGHAIGQSDLENNGSPHHEDERGVQYAMFCLGHRFSVFILGSNRDILFISPAF